MLCVMTLMRCRGLEHKNPVEERIRDALQSLRDSLVFHEETIKLEATVENHPGAPRLFRHLSYVAGHNLSRNINFFLCVVRKKEATCGYSGGVQAWSGWRI